MCENRREILLFNCNKGCHKSTEYLFRLYMEKSPLTNLFPECMFEFCAYPLGFILYFEPDEKRELMGTDITHFSDYSYEEKVDFKISLPILENNTWIPEDSRAKQK